MHNIEWERACGEQFAEGDGEKTEWEEPGSTAETGRGEIGAGRSDCTERKGVW